MILSGAITHLRPNIDYLISVFALAQKMVIFLVHENLCIWCYTKNPCSCTFYMRAVTDLKTLSFYWCWYSNADRDKMR
ncbi:hypothetical protein XELAEV_18044597mg [Xenopus laevis]|uniref:Uncharacterized protein n=1 Tax=Xenopus laevis TaxID=8355 RepID=A0A974H3H6_XENLA|nr:hypothetical protein XELAEV_18044597mg [Xenopus laevis]